MPEQFKVPLITVGADPELFVRNKKTKKFVSAHNLVPGTKKDPHKVAYGAVQFDGVAAEFNIEPTNTYQHFTSYCAEVQKSLKGFIGADNELVIEPTADFDPIYFDGLPGDVRELGCNPDFNGWTGEQNPSPDASGNPYMRTASGHVHVGWGKDFDINDPAHRADCNLVARQLDYALGITSLLWDPDNKRRSLYGKAGALRYKMYGMEYRTLSNKWLINPAISNYVASQTVSALGNLFRGINYFELFEDSAKKIIDENIVDWTQKKEYQEILKYISLPPVHLLAANSVTIEAKTSAKKFVR